MKLHVGEGCTYCNLSGYRGRIAIYELLEVDRTLADAIRRGDLNELDAAARSRPHFASLTDSAFSLAARGLTTLAEVMSIASGLEEEEDLSGVTSSRRSPFAGRSADPLLDDAMAESARATG